MTDLKDILFKKISIEEFFASHWQKKFVLLNNTNFEFESFEDITKYAKLNTKNTFFVKNAQNLSLNKEKLKFENVSSSKFETNEISINLEYINDIIFKQGYSAKIVECQNILISCSKLLQEFANLFNSKININAYYTPKNSNCFDHHHDCYNIFVFQLEGSKEWQIQSPDSYHKDFKEKSDKFFNEGTLSEKNSDDQKIVLNKGDVLYLPHSIAHSAKTFSKDSFHLTIGVHPKTLAETVQEFMDKNLDHTPAELEYLSGKVQSIANKSELSKLLLFLKLLKNNKN